jgi:hypothetical protein
LETVISGPVTLEVSSRGDVKAVHRDAHAVLDAGILHRTEGKIVFPFDAVRVSFVLQAA